MLPPPLPTPTRATALPPASSVSQVDILGHEERFSTPTKPDTSKTHTEFILRTTVTAGVDAGPPCIVRKRFSEFARLHAQLTKRVPRSSRLPPLPPKAIKRSGAGLDGRQSALQLWLRQVVVEPTHWCSDLRIFLGLQMEAPSPFVV